MVLDDVVLSFLYPGDTVEFVRVRLNVQLYYHIPLLVSGSAARVCADVCTLPPIVFALFTRYPPSPFLTVNALTANTVHAKLECDYVAPAPKGTFDTGPIGAIGCKQLLL